MKTLDFCRKHIVCLGARQRPVLSGSPVVSGGAVKSLWRVAQRGGLRVCDDCLFQGEVNREHELGEDFACLFHADFFSVLPLHCNALVIIQKRLGGLVEIVARIQQVALGTRNRAFVFLSLGGIRRERTQRVKTGLRVVLLRGKLGG